MSNTVRWCCHVCWCLFPPFVLHPSLQILTCRVKVILFFPLVLLKELGVTICCQPASFWKQDGRGCERPTVAAEVAAVLLELENKEGCWRRFWMKRVFFFAFLSIGFAKLEQCHGLFAMGQWHPVRAASPASWTHHIYFLIQTLMFFLDSSQGRYVKSACSRRHGGRQPDHLCKRFVRVYCVLQVFFLHLTEMVYW